MDKRSKQDLKISGSGSASGGSYNNVTISGQGDINGDFDCVELRISGSSDINGTVKAKFGKILGKATISGGLEANEFKVSGMLDVRDNVAMKEMRIEGGAMMRDSVTVEFLEIKGGIKVKNNCTAENFVSKGAFAIGGLLNADSVDIVLYGPCRAKEIGGEKIMVRKGDAFKIASIIKSILFSFDVDGGLVADIIEGDDISLEDTKAKAVRGNNVRIGAGCEIGLVEYKTKYEQAPDARVRESRKVR